MTLRCLRSLDALTYPHVSVVLVDNGSRDGTVEAVAATHPDVELVALPENRGFAGGVNAGRRGGARAAAPSTSSSSTTTRRSSRGHSSRLSPRLPGRRWRGVLADPPRGLGDDLVRRRRVRPPARTPGTAHGLRPFRAAAGDGAVPDRARLRRRDAHLARGLRQGRRCLTRRCSLTPRTSIGRSAPMPQAGLWSSSCPPASCTTASPQPRAAPPRRTPSTTRSATASSSPSGTLRSAAWPLAPEARRRGCLLRPGAPLRLRRAGLRAVADALRDARNIGWGRGAASDAESLACAVRVSGCDPRQAAGRPPASTSWTPRRVRRARAPGPQSWVTGPSRPRRSGPRLLVRESHVLRALGSSLRVRWSPRRHSSSTRSGRSRSRSSCARTASGALRIAEINSIGRMRRVASRRRRGSSTSIPGRAHPGAVLR